MNRALEKRLVWKRQGGWWHAVLLSGDFWQLDHTDGGFSVEFTEHARQFEPAPPIANGQSSLW